MSLTSHLKRRPGAPILKLELYEILDQELALHEALGRL